MKEAIERKYLIEFLTDKDYEKILEGKPIEYIEHYYTEYGDKHEIRYRKIVKYIGKKEMTTFYLTEKKGIGIARKKAEVVISEKDYEENKKNTGMIVQKDRYYISNYQNKTVVIDQFKGSLPSKLRIVEVKFDDLESALSYTKEKWMGQEITDACNFSNKEIAEISQKSLDKGTIAEQLGIETRSIEEVVDSIYSNPKKLTVKHFKKMLDSDEDLKNDELINIILDSKYFKNLSFKAQVISKAVIDKGQSDRLTHTLQVAKIAYYIAKKLGVDKRLAVIGALCHDIGHVAFGHDGEVGINNFMNSVLLNQGEYANPKYQEFDKIFDKYKKEYGKFKHENVSVDVFIKIFEENKGRFSDETLEYLKNNIERISEVIINHGGGIGNSIYLEGKIISLADKLAYLCQDFVDLTECINHEYFNIDKTTYNFDKLRENLVRGLIENSTSSEIDKNGNVIALVTSLREYMYGFYSCGDEINKGSYHMQNAVKYLIDEDVLQPDNFFEIILELTDGECKAISGEWENQSQKECL
ncbi:MAG: hypothetical protein A2Y24_08555 [Clostridiales bacterium GWE2_32_10]|nr:MAG: hypothetical protein A2Y24_08555 [Clostridiales bacterium GWE2_32_10]HBY19526.1 hypothetical protein [Clostridiales bacterium]